MSAKSKLNENVGIEKSLVKGDLFSVSVEGKKIGNFRTTDKGHRQGMGAKAVFHPLSMSVEDVANLMAEAHLADVATKAEAKEAAKKEAQNAKAERQNSDGDKKPARRGRSRKAKVNEEAVIAELEAEMEAAS